MRIPALDVVYILFLPYSAVPQVDTHSSPALPKGAPYFLNLDIDVVNLEEVDVTIHDVPIHVRPQLLEKQVWVAECRYSLADPFDKSAPLRMRQIQMGLRKLFMNAADLTEADGFEEYTIVHLKAEMEAPDHFVDQHAAMFAQFLRNTDLEKPLEKREIAKTLSSRLRYSSADLTVIDWNGAVMITDDGDIASDVDLFKIGNYQLLRYRMLDKSIEQSLTELQTVINRKKFAFAPRRNELMYQILNKRLEILLNYEKINQELLQIGDWYSSEMYRIIVEELYIDDWKETVNTKLESLASIHEIVSQNLSFSWSRFLDFVQMAGWLILLIGYFVLFYFDITAG